MTGKKSNIDIRILCVPRSCEPAAIQLLSACRIPGKGRTSQRNPGNDESNETHQLEKCTKMRKKECKNHTHLVIKFSCFNFKIGHPVIFDFFCTDLQHNKEPIK